MKKSKLLPKFNETDPEKVEICLMFEGWAIGDWVWCLHCQRCYKVGEFRYLKRYDFQLCPYDDCDGSPLDANHWWGSVEPERDKIYSPF